MKIFLDAPNVGKLEKKYVNSAIDSGYVSTVGPLVGEFENAFASYHDVPRAVSTQSGTASLHIALHELGIGKGDEVIVPALTFIATVNPVLQVGATPVFADVDPLTWNINPSQIEDRITKRTKAIIPVHLYGNPCDMDGITRIARKHKLYIIEDATESLGATWQGARAGTLGEIGCFSFNGTKIMTTGGGGMLIGKSDKRLAHIKFLVNQARDEQKGYYHPEAGFNYRMTNIEAALGLAQMQRLDFFLKRKRKFYAIYRKELGGRGIVDFQQEYPGAKSSRWLTCVTVTKKASITGLQKKLAAEGIPARRIFMPIPCFPPYEKYADCRHYPQAMHIYRNGLCLPGSTLNTDAAIRRSATALRRLLEC